MSPEQQLHKLRVQFIEKNMDYTRRVRKGENLTGLKELNIEINYLVSEIQHLEREIQAKKY